MPHHITRALTLMLFSALALAHPGGLDKSGCHRNSKTGDYHCHQSPGPTPTPSPVPSTPAPEPTPVTEEVNTSRPEKVKTALLSLPLINSPHCDFQSFACGVLKEDVYAATSRIDDWISQAIPNPDRLTGRWTVFDDEPMTYVLKPVLHLTQLFIYVTQHDDESIVFFTTDPKDTPENKRYYLEDNHITVFCADFKRKEVAQLFFEMARTDQKPDPYGLDLNKDGKACNE